MAKRASSLRSRVDRYRDRMRTRGFRQVNLWVPDTRSPGFEEECRRQSVLAAKADRALTAELELATAEIEGWTA